MDNRRNSRKNGGRRGASRSRGLFRTLYGPVSQALGLGDNIVGAVTNTTRNVARKGFRGVDRVGRAVTDRANSAVRGLLSRKNRRGGRRNSRRNSRRNNRRNSRRNSRRNNRRNSRRNRQ